VVSVGSRLTGLDQINLYWVFEALISCKIHAKGFV
jgi:hypothetical protein